MTTPAELLRETLELLRTEGWIKHNSYIPGEGYCVYGAVETLGARLQLSSQVIDEAEIRLRQVIHPLWEGKLSQWNDHPSTRFADIEDAFERAMR